MIGFFDWLDWWAPSDVSKMHKGGSQEKVVVALSDYPVWVKRGAFMPLAQDPASVPEFDASYPTQFTWFAPKVGTSATAEAREPSTAGPGASSTASLSADGKLEMTFSERPGLGSFRVYGVTKPDAWAATATATDGTVTVDCQMKYCTHHNILNVACMDLDQGVKFTATGVNPLF